MSLVAELKRRNVFKVGMAWLALGWVVTQVVATMAPYLRLPEWTVPMVAMIGVIGFPCVLIFSWVYELTPEGLKRESEIDRTQSITQVTGKRLEYTIIGLLVAAIAMFALDRFVPRPSQIEQNSRAEARPTTSPGVDGDVGRASARQEPGTAAAAPIEKSIAVLPFADMSAAKDQEYMSDGIAEELLNLLAKVPELKVTSRSSAFTFKGKDLEIPEIARRLNVAHVLEGSVRKSGNTVRITAQLVDARTDTHLWSETYDRPLDDIFAVQDEIARAVVAQLKIKLLGAAPKARETDPKAYALYLQARQLGRQATPEGYAQAITLHEQVLAIDPSYTPALDGLATSYTNQAGNGLRPLDEGYRMARAAVQKALAIDPEFANAHARLGYIAMNYDLDLAAAAAHYQHALALEPGNIALISNASILVGNLGHTEQVIAIDRYFISQDPANPTPHAYLGYDLLTAGSLEGSIASYRNALAISPGYLNAHYSIGVVLLMQGQNEAALAEMQAETSEPARLQGLAMAYYTLGKTADSDAALDEAIRKFEKDSSFNIAYVCAWRGEADRAFDWLDKAVIYHDPGLSAISVQPEIANLHKDPRWLPFLRRIGMAPEQLAAIKFEVNVPQ